jgi:succinate dehydrogenase / fumarate reductase, cytochrome b subunit
VTTLATRPVTPVLRSSIGKKAAMAGSGLLLFGFVVAHMLGNLKLFTGRTHFNEYAEGLRTLGEPILGREYALWGLRAALLAAVGVHIWAAWSTTRMSKAARPVSYRVRRPVQASYASRTMRWGGVILLLFIVYHLLHMTTGTVHEDFAHGDAYGNMVVAFQKWWIFAAYTVAVVALGLHVFHGFWSMFQTLGQGSGARKNVLRLLSGVFAGALVAGYLAGPLAILIGAVD